MRSRRSRANRGCRASAYAEELARLFLEEDDLGLKPSSALLLAFGLDRDALLRAPSAVSLKAAERAAKRENVVVRRLLSSCVAAQPADQSDRAFDQSDWPFDSSGRSFDQSDWPFDSSGRSFDQSDWPFDSSG
jgi:hypothetical protein